MKYNIQITETAQVFIKTIKDQQALESIIKGIDRLREDPEISGKPLKGELSGYYSIRAYKQRYRIIFQIDKTSKMIFIIAMGMRKEKEKKDIYNLLKKLIRQKLI